MEKQRDNTKSMNDSRKREKVGFNVGRAGGIVVIGATVVAAAIGAAFVAYRHKGGSKQGADRTSQNGIDEKTENDLLDLGKLEGSSDNLVVHESVNPKNKASADNSSHKDGENIEIVLGKTGDSSAESNIEAICLSEMIDQNKSSIKEEFAFGSLIEIQETNPGMAKEESNHKSSYNGSAINIETVKETREMSTVDIENNPSYDFSFWNNDQNKQTEIEDVVREASEKLKERSSDEFELEDEQRNGNTFVVTSEKSENGNYKQREENMQIEREIGGEKEGGAFVYVGVEVEQNGKGDGKLFEEEETNKVNDTANVVNGKENGKGEDAQSAVKETNEKDEGEEEEERGSVTYVEVEEKVVEEERGSITYVEVEEKVVEDELGSITYVEVEEKVVEDELGSITYVEVEEKVVEEEKEISTQNEQRKGDDRGHTEGEADDKDKRGDISLAELVEEEEADKVNVNTNYENVKGNQKGEVIQCAVKETDEKDEYKEVHGNITYVGVEGKVAEKEEKIAHNDERRGGDSGDTEAEEDGKDTVDAENIGNEENLGVYLSGKLAGQDKSGDVTPIEVREENSQKNIDYIQEKNNKLREDEEKEEHDDNTDRQFEEIAVEEEDHDEAKRAEEEKMLMENDNQDKCRDNIEVGKEENKGGKGADDDVDSSEENEEQKGEYIITREELQEDMKPVEVMENGEKRKENDGKLLLVEKIEDADISTPIEVGETESKNEEGNEINLIEQDIVNTKSEAEAEIEKDNVTAGSAYIGMEVEEQDIKGDIAYSEAGKGNRADDTYSVVHGQQNRKEEDDGAEITRKDDIVDKKIVEEEGVINKVMNEVEEDVKKIGVAKERPQDVIRKEEIKAENKDNIILQELEHDVEENGVELQSVEEQASREIALSDEVNKEIYFTQENGNRAAEEEGKDQDITGAEVGVVIAEEHEETPDVQEGRKAIENEKEDTYGDGSSIDGIINIKNNLEEGTKENKTANKELNAVESEEAKEEDVRKEEEIKTVEEMHNKNSEEKFNNMNKEIASESFAAFQKDDNVEKEEEDDEDDTMKEMKQQFADHSRIENSKAMEDTECTVPEKKNTTYMFMDHISKGLFLLVLAMSIAVVILSIFAQQNHLYYYYDRHLPQFCHEIFQIFSLSFNQTAEIQ